MLLLNCLIFSWREIDDSFEYIFLKSKTNDIKESNSTSKQATSTVKAARTRQGQEQEQEQNKKNKSKKVVGGLIGFRLIESIERSSNQ